MKEQITAIQMLFVFVALILVMIFLPSCTDDGIPKEWLEKPMKAQAEAVCSCHGGLINEVWLETATAEVVSCVDGYKHIVVFGLVDSGCR